MKKMSTDDIIFQLEQIINNLPGNAFWKDDQDKFLGCNENVARILKLKSPKDIVGKTDEEVLGKEYAKLVKDVNTHVIKNGEEISVEEIGFNEKGEKAIYLSTKKPLFDKRKKVVGLIGTSIDITKQKQAEIAKSEFLGNMAHDLRTPFSGIISITESLKRSEKDVGRKELLDLVSVSGRRLLDLINQVLEIIRLGEMPFQEEQFNIRELAEEIIEIMSPEIEVKKLGIDLDCPDKKIKADRFRIHRILLNLLSNAVRYTKKGHIQIIIKTSPALKIEVKDTGIGIPEDKFDIIFDRFGKVDRSEKNSSFTGLGLGLFIAKQFAQELNGDIHVASQLGKGSCFTFQL